MEDDQLKHNFDFQWYVNALKNPEFWPKFYALVFLIFVYNVFLHLGKEIWFASSTSIRIQRNIVNTVFLPFALCFSYWYFSGSSYVFLSGLDMKEEQIGFKEGLFPFLPKENQIESSKLYFHQSSKF